MCTDRGGVAETAVACIDRGGLVCGVGRVFGSTCSELQHQLGTNRQGFAERREELDEERAGDEVDLLCGAAQLLGGGQRQMQVGHDEPRPADRASGLGRSPRCEGGHNGTAALNRSGAQSRPDTCNR
jgi:hypothetical protein